MKKVLFIILLFLPLWVAAQTAPPTGTSHRPKVAVVLSGGGAKGVAHISCLRAIEEAGLPIDMICGTSMGALIGGLYAIGWTTDELDSLVRHQDWSYILSDRVPAEELDMEARRLLNTYPLWHAFTLGSKRNEGAGFIRGVNLDRLFSSLLEGYLDSLDFNTLPIPFACVATDIITNTEIDFHNGYLKEALRASMSIPGVFSPVRKGNMLLVDGGMRNNFPTDLAREMGADIIIGVAVLDDTLTANDIKGPGDLVMQIIDLSTKNKLHENLTMSDILMRVDVRGYSAASFTSAAIDTLLRRGADEASLHRDELLALRINLEKNGGQWTRERPRRKRPIKEKEGKEFKLTAPNPILLSPLAGVAFRFDNEETGVLQIGARLPFTWHLPMETGVRIRLGKRMQFNINHQLYPHGFSSPTLNYNYNRNDIDIYAGGIRTYNIKYSQHTFRFSPLNSLFRQYKISAGLRYDYYDYDPVLSAHNTTIDPKDQQFISYFFESVLNTEDDWYYPTKGTQFLVGIAYHTDNFISYHGLSGVPEASIFWRVNIHPASRFTIQPAIFSRLVFGDQMPLAYINTLGTRQKIVEQQIEFPGVHSLVQVERYIVGLQLNFQYFLAEKRYILLHSAAARHEGDLKNYINREIDLTSAEYIYGISLGYAYDSFLGPIEASIGYSSLAPGLNFYLNVGHNF